MKEEDLAKKYLEADIKMVEEFGITMKDLSNAVNSCVKTTDWLIRNIPGWKLLKEKEFARLCECLKLRFARSNFTEKEWSKMLGIKKRTIHKLLHDPVPEMNIQTYFKLKHYFSLPVYEESKNLCKDLYKERKNHENS